MAHSDLTEIRGVLDDAQDTELFDFIIPDVPGGSAASGRDLAVLCQQAVYPGRANEIMEAPLHAQHLNFSGRVTMPRTMSITFIEHADMRVTNVIQEWFEFQRGTNSGVAAGYKREYSIDGAVLIKYDVTGAIADQVVFYGLQPEDLPDQQLDGSSTNLYTVAVTFRYDWYDPKNITQR